MRLKEILTLTLDTVTQTMNSQTIPIIDAESVAIVANIINDNPSAVAFTANATTNVLTAVAHGFKTGLKGQATTTGGLPGGLSVLTDYYIIKLDADTFSLATSYANAILGTAIDITTTGTGIQTFTPTALAGANLTIQWSIDEIVWNNVASATNIVASGVITAIIDRPAYPFIKLKYTLTAGQLSVNNKLAIKNKG